MVRNHEHVGIHQRNLYRLWDMAVSYLYQEIMPVSVSGHPSGLLLVIALTSARI